MQRAACCCLHAAFGRESVRVLCKLPGVEVGGAVAAANAEEHPEDADGHSYPLPVEQVRGEEVRGREVDGRDGGQAGRPRPARRDPHPAEEPGGRGRAGESRSLPRTLRSHRQLPEAADPPAHGRAHPDCPPGPLRQGQGCARGVRQSLRRPVQGHWAASDRGHRSCSAYRPRGRGVQLPRGPPPAPLSPRQDRPPLPHPAACRPSHVRVQRQGPRGAGWSGRRRLVVQDPHHPLRPVRRDGGRRRPGVDRPVSREGGAGCHSGRRSHDAAGAAAPPGGRDDSTDAGQCRSPPPSLLRWHAARVRGSQGGDRAVAGASVWRRRGGRAGAGTCCLARVHSSDGASRQGGGRQGASSQLLGVRRSCVRGGQVPCCRGSSYWSPRVQPHQGPRPSPPLLPPGAHARVDPRAARAGSGRAGDPGAGNGRGGAEADGGTDVGPSD
mmetsp:Transcript_44303/g.139773  ORF Transcript_44303/g.139773 Transcript_44303/m.139773 type:complete len:440 (-) Transcript_44303:14-1333(-)